MPEPDFNKDLPDDPKMTVIAMRNKDIVSLRDELQAFVASAHDHPELTVDKASTVFATVTGPKSALEPFIESFDRALLFERDQALQMMPPAGPGDASTTRIGRSDDALRFRDDDEINEL